MDTNSVSPLFSSRPIIKIRFNDVGIKTLLQRILGRLMIASDRQHG